MSSEEMRIGRRRGRASRVASRTADVAEINPCPPGQSGGQYKPLAPTELADIIDTSFRVLAKIGMAEVPPKLLQQALEKGAKINNAGRLTFSRDMVEDIINAAAKTFIFHGRDPQHDFEIGGDRVYYGTGGAAVQTLDLEQGKYRSSTLKDLYDFTRLADRLENISWFTRCCVATDVENNLDLDVNTAYALIAGTTKPVGTSFTVAANVDPVIDMFDIALGGQDRFRRRPFCMAHISPVISPLSYGADAVEVAIACMSRGVPINAVIAGLSGATCPAAPAGMLVQTTAETLAALVMVNIFEAGYPMIFSNWPFVIDLRSGAFCGGGGEISIMNAASAQISSYFGLPSGAACSMADAKAVDAQMGSEKAMSAVAAGLAGANMVYESSGMMASLLGASFEAFVLDNEMLSHVNRMIRGFEVNEETLGFDAIRTAVTGEGHFLGSEDTMAAMQRDYFYPSLADRNQPGVWQEEGQPDIRQVAATKARQILSAHYPAYLSAEVDSTIREKFNILLKPAELKKPAA